MGEFFEKLYESISGVLEFSLFTIGQKSITVGTALQILIFCFALIYFSKKLKNWIVRVLLAKRDVEHGQSQSIANIVHYSVLLLGLAIIVQTAGIDLSTISFLAGALGIGIGFGLQNIASNIVSGVILLIEKPIKVGDRVEIEGTIGDIKTIGLRATEIVTLPNIAIIVPNSDFINNRVTNWSHADTLVRYEIPVGVSYDEDPEQISELLKKVAHEHPQVVASPPPDVLFEEFGDSSLNFVLRVWMNTLVKPPRVLRSELNFAISKIFRENGVVIPFPQRDIHFRSGTIDLKKSD